MIRALIPYLFLMLLTSACALYPAQHPGVQPEVVLHYKWWNNLAQQPVAWIELRNTTEKAYHNFQIHVKSFNEEGRAITAFDVMKDFTLFAGEKRSFRVVVPTSEAHVVKVYMVGYDEAAPDRANELLVLETEGQ